MKNQNHIIAIAEEIEKAIDGAIRNLPAQDREIVIYTLIDYLEQYDGLR